MTSPVRPRPVLVQLVVLGLLTATLPAVAQQRPMTFLDLQQLRSAGNAAVSPDGHRMLYTLSVPDWKEARRTTDIYLVSVDGGVPSTRQMTFTRDKNETNPAWSRDGSFFVFSSNREVAESRPATRSPSGAGREDDEARPAAQLYLMRPDGGEARRLTDARDGVADFAFSRDGKWLVYAAGKAEARQLWALPVAGIDSVRPRQLSRHATPIHWWTIAPDSRRIYFTAPDTVDKDNLRRVEEKFTATIRNEPQPTDQLWALEVDPGTETRLTSDTSYSVGNVTLSRDGRWLGFRGTFNNRYQRNITGSSMYADVYLLETATGRIERLTNNAEIGESAVSFSPDGSMIAIAAENDWTYFRDDKLYVRPTAQRGAPWRKLGGGFDGAMSVGWWSADGKTIYFTTGVRATRQVMAASVETGAVRPVTSVTGAVSADLDQDTGLILVNYEDNASAPDLYAVRSVEGLADRARWTRLTSSNPQVAGMALGDAEEITWKSRDGKTVGGVLVKPVGWQVGRRYPLIVQIHGGPASADLLDFSLGTGAQVYAGNGYAVLLPNYRGSTNYGERHRLDIVGVGNYFQKGYEDIMTGVDFLIGQGIAHPDSMGAMGWSAGGHWSNWILTHTNRFKAISSGAGAMNWISMYAQSDVQRNRAEYFANGQKPWENFDAYWQVSPLRFIRNARTPTLIHVVDGDPRVPRPQSEELHMALKQLGVPTEFFVYPGNTHGIPDPRNRYLKAVAEYTWFEKWIRGKPWFTWKELLQSVDDASGRPADPAGGPR